MRKMCFVFLLVAIACGRLSPAPTDGGVRAEHVGLLHAVVRGFVMPQVFRGYEAQTSASARVLLLDETVRCGFGESCAPAKAFVPSRGLPQPGGEMMAIPPVNDPRVAIAHGREVRELIRGGTLDEVRRLYGNVVAVAALKRPTRLSTTVASVQVSFFRGNQAVESWLVEVERADAGWHVRQSQRLWIT